MHNPGKYPCQHLPDVCSFRGELSPSRKATAQESVQHVRQGQSGNRFHPSRFPGVGLPRAQRWTQAQVHPAEQHPLQYICGVEPLCGFTRAFKLFVDPHRPPRAQNCCAAPHSQALERTIGNLPHAQEYHPPIPCRRQQRGCEAPDHASTRLSESTRFGEPVFPTSKRRTCRSIRKPLNDLRNRLSELLELVSYG